MQEANKELGENEEEGAAAEEAGMEEDKGKEKIMQGIAAKPIHQPRQPSKSEVEEHELTHIPFRCWCVHCVRGLGRSNPHKSAKVDAEEEDRLNAVTTWSMDCCFMVEDGNIYSRQDMEDLKVPDAKVKSTVLVTEDRRSGGIKAHVAQMKGATDEWLVDRICKDMEEFGYGGVPVRIKSDQEPAIVQLQTSVIGRRGDSITVPVNSPVGDSASNGRVENAIKRVRGMVKVIRSGLEAKWGVRVGPDHPVYPWLFEWAADLITRYAEVGSTGKSAAQLIKGNRSSRSIAQFGEKVMYMPLKLSNHPRGKMESN